MEEETWREVPGSNGRYQIDISTKEGRCRSLGYKGSKKTKELTTRLSGDGRIYWGLMIAGRRRVQQAARWIAETYPELVQNEYFEGAEIEHIDADKLNNQPDNLRWVTHKMNQNNLHSVQRNRVSHTGKKVSQETKQKMRESHLNREDQSKPVLHYDCDGILIGRYIGCNQAARETKISSASISKYCNEKRKPKDGTIWRYET